MRANCRPAMVVLLVLAGPAQVMAQEDASTSPSDWQVGGSIGIAGSGTEFAPLQFFTVNFHASKGRPERVGVDFAAGTLPRFILEGVLPFGARLGATIRIGSANVTWWPSAGVSAAGLVGEGGGGGLIGGYVGSAVTWFPEDTHSGFRIDGTLHRFNGSVIWLLEFGFVRRR